MSQSSAGCERKNSVPRKPASGCKRTEMKGQSQCECRSVIVHNHVFPTWTPEIRHGLEPTLGWVEDLKNFNHSDFWSRLHNRSDDHTFNSTCYSAQAKVLKNFNHFVEPATAMQAGTKETLPTPVGFQAVSPVCMTCPVCCPRQQGLQGNHKTSTR